MPKHTFPWLLLFRYVCFNNSMEKTSKMIKDIIGNNIRKYRKRAKLSQAKASEKADLTLSYWQRLEMVSQKDIPSVPTLFAIASALNIQAYKLIKDD